MTIKTELLSLKENGLIVPERVVAWADKHRKSALYASLEWDNAAAGYQYRLWQVRRLIAITIVSDEGVRTVVSLSSDRREKLGGYREVDDVLPIKRLREIMLNDAIADLDRVEEKHQMLHELAAVWEAKEKVKAKARKTAGGGRGAIERRAARQA